MNPQSDQLRTLHEYAERALLAAIFHDPFHAVSLSPHLESYFDTEQHATLYAAIRAHASDIALHRMFAPLDMAHEWAHDLLQRAPNLRHSGIDTTYLEALLDALPHGPTQPALYSHIIIDAGIRRELAFNGVQVGRASTHTPEIDTMIAVIGRALTDLVAIQDRWRDTTTTVNRNHEPEQPHPQPRPGFYVPARPTESRTAAPGTTEIHQAQERLIGSILTNPYAAAALARRLRPEDFTDPQLATIMHATRALHTSGETRFTVDPVLIAWYQTSHATELGPTAPLHRLQALAETARNTPDWELDQDLDLVMRASLARTGQQAAKHVRELSQRPELQPAQILDEAAKVYSGIYDTAARLLPTGHEPGRPPPASSLHQDITEQNLPTTAQLTALRTWVENLITDNDSTPRPNLARAHGDDPRLHVDIDHHIEPDF